MRRNPSRLFGLRRVHVDRVDRREVHPLERAQADEVERLRLAARARVLSGHEDVDTGDLAVADVVHIGKLLSDEGFVAEIAVQEDGKPCRRFRLDVLRRRRLGGRSEHHKDSSQATVAGDRLRFVHLFDLGVAENRGMRDLAGGSGPPSARRRATARSQWSQAESNRRPPACKAVYHYISATFIYLAEPLIIL